MCAPQSGPLRDVHGVIQRREEGGRRQRWANLERVRLTILKICHAYDLQDVSLYSLNTFLSISALDPKTGSYHQRQVSIVIGDLNLERLRDLNDLSYKVVKEVPNVSTLDSLLDEVKNDVYPWWIILLGFLLAMACLSRIFGATYKEMIIALLNTVIIYFLSMLFKKIKLNHIITNFVATFITGSITIFFYHIGFIGNFYVAVITSLFTHLIIAFLAARREGAST